MPTPVAFHDSQYVLMQRTYSYSLLFPVSGIAGPKTNSRVAMCGPLILDSQLIIFEKESAAFFALTLRSVPHQGYCVLVDEPLYCRLPAAAAVKLPCLRCCTPVGASTLTRNSNKQPKI